MKWSLFCMNGNCSCILKHIFKPSHYELGRCFTIKWRTEDGDVHLLRASCPNFNYEIYSAKMEAHSAIVLPEWKRAVVPKWIQTVICCVRGLFHEMVPDANLGGDAFAGPVWRVLHCRTSTMGFHFGTTARFLWAIPLKSRAIPPTILLILLSDYIPLWNDPLSVYDMTPLCLWNDPLFQYIMYVEPLS